MSKIPKIVNQFDLINFEANQQVFAQGQTCENYVVVTSGFVKVYARSIEGRELVLYRIKPGEICVLTTACLMGNTHYPAEAITESEVSARIIPHQQFNQLIETSSEFRQFIFHNFSQRLTDLMAQIEQVSLESIDQRLNRYLLTNTDLNNVIQTTHKEIAVEIGSSREVVSRHLKTFENKKIINLSRGSITVLNRNLLER